MVIRRLIAPNIDFSALRRELRLPTQFSPAAQREADEVAARRPVEAPAAGTPRAAAAPTPGAATSSGAGADGAAGNNTGAGGAGANTVAGGDRADRTERADRTDIEFVTIDPPTSMDLDQ